MEYKVKVNSTLSFNLEAERDIVANIEKLKSQHRLGEFISNCIRVALDNPELLEKNNTSLESFKLTDNRKKFMDATKIEISKVASKIEETYKLAYEMYTLAKFNKKFDLYSSSKNVIASQFILAKQVEDLKNLLGVVTLEQTVNLHKVDISTDDILEYIILAHQDIIDELKENKVTFNHIDKLDKYDKKLDELNSLLDKHSIDSKATNDDKVLPVDSSEPIDDNKDTKNSQDDNNDILAGFGGFKMSDNADLAGLADLLGIN